MLFSHRVTNQVLFALLLILASAINVSAEDSEATPPVFPTADNWTAKDFRQAVAFLTDMSASDPLNLPRADADDGRFNSLIDRLKRITDTMDFTKQDNWKDIYPQEAAFNQQFTNEILMPIFAAYSVTEDQFNIVYERETLVLLPLIIDSLGVNIKVVRLMAGDQIHDAPETWPAGFQDKLTRLTVVNGRVTNAIIRLLIHPGQLHPELLSKTLQDCKEPLTHSLWAMNEADRDMANETLELLKLTIEDPADKEVVDALISAERLPPEKLSPSGSTP